MKFSRYTAALLLWYCFAKTESEKNGWGWGIYLDYALLCSLVILILGFGIEIWRTIKDRNDSQSEHTGIKENDNSNKNLLSTEHSKIAEEHNRLSSEHIRLSTEHNRLSSEHSQLKSGQVAIAQTTSEIRQTVYSIDKQLAVEQTRRDDLMKSMTTQQSNVHSQINAIYALNQQLPALQYEKQQISQKYEELLQKYTTLQHDYDLLVSQNRKLQQDLDDIQQETEEFSQTLE